MLLAARSAGLIVQENIVRDDADRTSIARTLRDLQEAAKRTPF